MSKVVDTLFGDKGKGAQKAQTAENLANQEFIQKQVERARGEAIPLFQSGQEARQRGTQAALDIFGQTIPGQAGVFQQGNVGAQQALLAGLPQFQAAILGQPVDFGALQAQQLTPDLSFAQAQIPDFQGAQEALAPPPQQAQQPGAGSFLGGIGGFQGFGGVQRGGSRDRRQRRLFR